MRVIYFISVFLHILSVVIWLGGTLFLTIVLVPWMRKTGLAAKAGQLLQEIGARFRFWAWVCLMTLFVTGTFNLMYRFNSVTAFFDKTTWQGFWGHTFGMKLVFYAIILGLSAIHDFRIGPRATQLMEQDPGGAETLKLRKQAGWIGRINLILALVIIFLALILVRGLPW